MKPLNFFDKLLKPLPLYVAILSILTLYSAVWLFNSFPNIYTWQELFINYAGGFIRRGLLGEILFWADRAIPVRIFYLVGWTLCFYLFLYCAYVLLRRVFDSLVVAFLFITPTLFAFPVLDRYVFARKDLFIEIIILACAFIVVQHMRRKTISLNAASFLCCLLFALGMLIHEMMIFYFPLTMILLGMAYAQKNRLWQWLILNVIIFGAALLLVFSFSGDAITREAIRFSWAARYPGLTAGGGLAAIGRTFQENTAQAFAHHQNWISLGSFAACLLLSALPLLFLGKAYNPGAAIRQLLSSRLLRLAFWPAVISPFILSIITTDFGRHLSVGFIAYLFFLYAVCAIAPQPEAVWLCRFREKLAVTPKLRIIALVLAVLFGLGWRMVHYQASGGSYLKPGPLFLWL